MAICSELDKDILIDCVTPIIPGVFEDFYLGNTKDVASYAITAGTKHGVEALVMKSGKKIWKFEGQNDSTTPKSAAERGRYVTGFAHSVAFIIFKNDVAVKDTLVQIGSGNLFALVQNKDKQWEIYGLNVGMVASLIERDPYDAETNGAYKLELKTGDVLGKEPTLPHTFFDTDAATTELAVTALTVAA